MQGTCVRMNDGIDLTVYAQNEMRILGEDIDGTLAMPNRPLSGRIIMAYGACQGTGRRYFAAVRPSPTSSVGRRNYRDGAASIRAVEGRTDQRSEEHTSELQSLMRISYAVFCLKKKTNRITIENYQ